MNHSIFGILAESALHPGSGKNAGAIDLPVSREVTTGTPVIAGSSLKGALRQKAREAWTRSSPETSEASLSRAFGHKEGAGELLVGDASVILLPVRTLSGMYLWLTCPLLLERLHRSMKMAGIDEPFLVPEVGKNELIMFAKPGTRVALEERVFEAGSLAPSASLINVLAGLIPHETTAVRLKKQIGIVSSDDFAWFARNALPIQARNQLEEGTKQSQNLWYEETLPQDTVLYSLVGERMGGGDAQAASELRSLITKEPYLQVGGNETVGQGYVSMRAFAARELMGAEA